MFSEMEFLLFLYDIIGYLVLIYDFYYIVLKEKVLLSLFHLFECSYETHKEVPSLSKKTPFTLDTNAFEIRYIKIIK